MNFTMQNANGSIEEPLALLDFGEISLRFSQPAIQLVDKGDKLL